MDKTLIYEAPSTETRTCAIQYRSGAPSLWSNPPRDPIPYWRERSRGAWRAWVHPVSHKSKIINKKISDVD